MTEPTQIPDDEQAPQPPDDPRVPSTDDASEQEGQELGGAAPAVGP